MEFKEKIRFWLCC